MSDQNSPATDRFIGQVIDGKYRLEERLGRGGFGAVYRARHIKTDGDLAVKVLHHDLMGDETIVARFEREARTTHKLHHPNTVRLTDVGRMEDGGLFIAMEYVQGQTLADVLKTAGILDLPRSIRIVSQILKSLGEAHEHQLVHRDIKPDNIMLLDAYGEPDFVKVLDFGIAKNDDTSTALTQGLIGTPRYIAPEQWLAQDVDQRVDLYALGCLFYEMLTGRLPFEGHEQISELNGLMWGHVHRPYVPLSIVAPGQFRSDIDQLLGDLVAKAPDARPATAADALQRLMALDVSPLQDASLASRPIFDGDTLDGCISPEEPALASTPPDAMDDLITKTARTSSVRTSTLIWGLPLAALVIVGLGVAYFLIGDGNSTGPLPASNQGQTELDTPARGTNTDRASGREQRAVTQKVNDSRVTPPQRANPDTPSDRTVPSPMPAIEPTLDAAIDSATEGGLEEQGVEKAVQLTWQLRSQPRRARVRIRQLNQQLGTTPITTPINATVLKRLHAGATLTLEFSKAGYHTATRTVRWAEFNNARFTADVSLKRTAPRVNRPGRASSAPATPMRVSPSSKATSVKSKEVPANSKVPKTPSKPALPTLRID